MNYATINPRELLPVKKVATLSRYELIDQINDGILVFDRDFILVDINKAAFRVLDHLPFEPLGKPLKEVLSAYPTLPVLYQRSLLVQQDFVADIKEGEEVYEVTFTPLYQGERNYHLGCVIRLHSITERKNSERAIAKLAWEKSKLLEQVNAGREQLKALSSRLVELQDEERRRIALELHDETGQALTSLSVGLGLLQQELGPNSTGATRVSELKELVNEIMSNLHRLAVDLHPVSLDKLGLADSVQQYAERFANLHGLQLELELNDLEGIRLQPKTEITLYRILQEALTNISRHAQAGNVDILLQQRNKKIILVIEDDGLGFDFEMAIKQGRMGLLGIKTRIEQLGGRFTVESVPSTGTTLTVELPVG
jgi:signal transduction histidine kinase